MHVALQQETWDLVLAEWNLPQFSALFALEMLKSQRLDLPFIIVSGTIGEEAAALALKAGAHDFICKQNINRLVLIVERELQEADERRARRKAGGGLGGQRRTASTGVPGYERRGAELGSLDERYLVERGILHPVRLPRG
jgi:two-component system, OmpR family, phosphate regulon sensor histidine kinase PhoR